MTLRERQLLTDGPMTCRIPSCVAWRAREPELAQKLQDSGMIAHYMGQHSIFGGDYWMLDGITPIPRSALMSCLKEREK